MQHFSYCQGRLRHVNYNKTLERTCPSEKVARSYGEIWGKNYAKIP